MSSSSKFLAFYLPQYHPITENNKWWGTGFTEWTNVAKARPNFEGHYQPHIPRDLGFYDLRRTETFREQAALAKEYGIHGFCFYWYWFNGKQLLETPLYNLLNDKSIDLPFCFCWANENWTRTWDGQDKEVLMKQDYDEALLASDFIDKLLPFFRDDRYIKVDNKPVFLVYRANIIPKIKQIVSQWRERLHAEGFEGIHLVSVYSFEISNYRDFDFDAGVEFPPHKFFDSDDVINSTLKVTNSDFSGVVYDYRGAIVRGLNRSYPHDDIVYRGAIPCWDNTARRQHTGHIMHNSSPELFQYWLTKLLQKNVGKSSEFIFINAWNEWGEGCHLEPDLKYQHQFLEAVRQAKLQQFEATPPEPNQVTSYVEQKTIRGGSTRSLKEKIKSMPTLYKIVLPIYKALRIFR